MTQQQQSPSARIVDALGDHRYSITDIGYCVCGLKVRDNMDGHHVDVIDALPFIAVVELPAADDMFEALNKDRERVGHAYVWNGPLDAVAIHPSSSKITVRGDFEYDESVEDCKKHAANLLAAAQVIEEASW